VAIATGVHPHRAWLSVNGTLFPVLHGTAVQEGTRQSSTFQATVPLNYPGARQALANLGDNSSGVVVESNGKTGTLVMGEIDATAFTYGQNGTIVVNGRCSSTKLHNKIIHENFVDKTTVEVVEAVAGEAGLGVVATGGGGMMMGKKLDEQFNELVDGQSAASIVTKCAEMDNARWWVDTANTLHYDIQPQGGGGYSVTYHAGPPERADFFTLEIVRNVQAGKEIETYVKSWHPEEKQAAEGEGQVGGDGGPVQYEFQVPTQLQEQAQQYAQNKANEIARHEITVKAHVVGDPTIDVDTGLAVSGTDFDGAYIIDNITHQFGMKGHTMTITARNKREGGSGEISGESDSGSSDTGSAVGGALGGAIGGPVGGAIGGGAGGGGGGAGDGE
jgi:hypothetical protein